MGLDNGIYVKRNPEVDKIKELTDMDFSDTRLFEAYM